MGRFLLVREEEDIVSSAWKHAAAKADAVQRTVLKIYDKTAVTNGVTFAALDPQRSDGNMWEWFYVPAAA